MFKLKNTAICLFLTITLVTSVTMAAEFPVKPIQLICPYSAGGSTDRFTRIAAKHASKYLPKPMVVVNRTGGGGAVGVSHVVNAKPDGYTLLTGVLTFLFMHKTVPGVKFTSKDFRGVVQLANDQLFYGVKAGTKADLPLDKFVAMVKSKPEEVVIGIGSNWGAYDLIRIIFEREAGIKFRRVSFKGGAGTIKALLGGFCDVFPTFPGEFSQHVTAGTSRYLAVARDKRMPEWPDVPTFKEYGYNVIWQQPRFILAPAGTPDDVIETLHGAFKKAYNDPEWKADMKKAGFPMQYRNPTDLGRFLVETLKRLDKPVEIMIEEKTKAAK